MFKFLSAGSILAAIIALTSDSSAHSVPLSGRTPAVSVAATPRQLEVAFRKAVVPELSNITVIRSNGEAVPVGELRPDLKNEHTLVAPLDRPLRPGSYRVRWSAVSVDAEKIEGSQALSIWR